jgi:hypothetical protein
VQEDQEEPVKSYFRHGTIVLGALALLGGLGAASAQIGSTPPAIQDSTIGRGDPTAQLRLSETQKSAIAEAVRRENKAVDPPPSFVVQVGAPVPPAIELHILPDAALASVPAAKTVKYTVVRNQLVLVDPTTMRVVDVIPQ